MPCQCGVCCEREAQTSDELGIGPGPIVSDENVLLAVFDEDAVIGEYLLDGHFPSKDIARGNFSLARTTHTTYEAFKSDVVAPKEDEGILLVGGVQASVATLRDICRDADWLNPIQVHRAVSVLDKIVAGDHKGHAASQFCRQQNEALSQQKLGPFRRLIAADLADAFGVLMSPEETYAAFASPDVEAA